MDQPLIAEDLLLLLLDDSKGTVPTSASARPVLGGALLVELALLGAVEVEAKTSVWKSAKVRAVGQAPTDPELATAWAVVGERERGAQDLVGRLGKGAQERIGDRLAARGIVERREERALGLFRRTVWPEVDSAREAEVRRSLTSTLVQGTTPDDRTGALVALLSAIGWAHKVVDHEGLPTREVKQRAQQVAEGDWAAKAVKDAVAAANAAVIAATTTAAVAGTTAGG